MAVIGIDLGTTNSLASTYRNGKVELIKDINGESMIPSAFALDEEGNVLIGNAAKQRQILHPQDCALEFKRQMGRTTKVIIRNRPYSPEELSAYILKKCKDEAEHYLGEEVTEAVISVPAYFDNKKRLATKRAAQLAGLHCERILNEPSAAALAYRIDQHIEEEQFMMVIDFGGGTLDVSLVDCFENIVEIIGVSGNNMLGGKNFDEAIVEAFIKENNINKEELSNSDYALLKRNAEESKIQLSAKKQVHMQCVINETTYAMELSSEKLIKLCGHLLLQLKEIMVTVIKDANCRIEEITDVVLTGGTCKLQIVRDYISELFHRELICDTTAQTLVAKGIGYYVGIKNREVGIQDILMTDVCPFSLGTGITNRADHEDVMDVIIRKNSSLPKVRTKSYVPLHKDQKSIQFDLYQGEQYHVKGNLKLGEFKISIPEGAADRSVEVTMAYDVNGILYVEAINSKGERVDYAVTYENDEMNQQEMLEKARVLREQKFLPRELEECTAYMEQAKYLYETAGGMHKDYLAECIEGLMTAKEICKNVEGVKLVRYYKERIEKYMQFANVDPFA